jgi:hypothetical protein
MSLLSIFHNTVTSTKVLIGKIFYDVGSTTLSVPNLCIEPVDVTTVGELRLKEVASNGSNYVGFKSPDALSANLIFEMPESDGLAGQIITTDGNKKLTFTNKATVFGTGTEDFTSTGQTEFLCSISLLDKIVVATHNGIMKKIGDDYSIVDNSIVFTYTIPSGHWVSAIVLPNSMNQFDFTSTGQTQFTAAVSLTGKNIIVTHLGITKRLGIDYDYTVSGSVVTFTYTIPDTHWVSIIILG